MQSKQTKRRIDSLKLKILEFLVTRNSSQEELIYSDANTKKTTISQNILADIIF